MKLFLSILYIFRISTKAYTRQVQIFAEDSNLSGGKRWRSGVFPRPATVPGSRRDGHPLLWVYRVDCVDCRVLCRRFSLVDPLV